MDKNKITPCLWFDKQSEEAANFYTAIIKNSKLKVQPRTEKEVMKYTEEKQAL